LAAQGRQRQRKRNGLKLTLTALRTGCPLGRKKMTTLNEAFRAGIDAVIADNSLSRGDFGDAMRTVLTANFSPSEATALVDAIAAEYNRLGLISNPTYNNLRGMIIGAASADQAEALFEALGAGIGLLPEVAPANLSAQLIDLRDERDNVDGAITRLDDLIAAEPPGTVGRLVKETFRFGKDQLRQQKEQLRDAIRNITGDPDN
jgi:hypothetical protein